MASNAFHLLVIFSCCWLPSVLQPWCRSQKNRTGSFTDWSMQSSNWKVLAHILIKSLIDWFIRLLAGWLIRWLTFCSLNNFHRVRCDWWYQTRHPDRQRNLVTFLASNSSVLSKQHGKQPDILKTTSMEFMCHDKGHQNPVRSTPAFSPGFPQGIPITFINSHTKVWVRIRCRQNHLLYFKSLELGATPLNATL